MKPAKLVHIAVRYAEARSLANFYKEAFGLTEVLSNATTAGGRKNPLFKL
jgi:hypothetical protein